MKVKFIIGIDPGLTGGIVTLSPTGKVLFKQPMPIIGVKKERGLDYERLLPIFQSFDQDKSLIFLEDISIITRLNSATTALSLGKQLGILDFLIWDYQLRHRMVPPKEWQAKIFDGTDSRLKPKERAKEVYERNFSKVDLTPTPKSKKPHDGMLDALLIAEFGRRELYQADEIH